MNTDDVLFTLSSYGLNKIGIQNLNASFMIFIHFVHMKKKFPLKCRIHQEMDHFYKNV